MYFKKAEIIFSRPFYWRPMYDTLYNPIENRFYIHFAWGWLEIVYYLGELKEKK